MIYPAHLQPEPEGGYTVTFRDVPPAITCGGTLDEALARAQSALISGLSFWADEGRALPPASAPKRGEHLVFVPALDQAKLALIARMAELGIGNAELARRLGVTEAVVRRLVNFNHRSRIDGVEAALAALGRRVALSIEAAAGV
jgi:antitoxin HicB